MASPPVANYNPEISLLQGGTAPIIPVQGGGGMGGAPPGYNPDQSLLQADSQAHIVAVKGGALGKPEDESQRLYEEYVLEEYEPILRSLAIPKLPEDDTRKRMRQNKIKQYFEQSKKDLKELQSFLVNAQEYEDIGDNAPTYQKCKLSVPLRFFERVRRRIVLIDTPSPYIWVIPNLNGNLSLFFQYMEKIPKDANGLIEPNHYVLFTGSFFSSTSKTATLDLYDQYLTVKLQNMNNIYCLLDKNADLISNSCTILESAHSVSYLQTIEGRKKKPLPLFIEPDIIVFTKVHIVFKNCKLPVQQDNPDVKISSILKKSELRPRSFLLVPSEGETDEGLDSHDIEDDVTPELQYFFFDYRDAQKNIKVPSTSYIECPEDTSCDGFKGGYKLIDLKDERKLTKPGLYLLYRNTDRMPFFKEEGATLPLKPIAKEPEVPKAKEEKPRKVEVKKEEEEEELEEEEEEEEFPFEASSDAYAESNEESINLQLRTYKLRMPFEEKVFNDWLAGRFTENEVQFLKGLSFTPKLLSDTFGAGKWKQRLAEFLETILLSKCFVDTRLITNIECTNAQEFIKQIYLEQYTRKLIKLYEGFSFPMPDEFMVEIKEFIKTKPAFQIAAHEFTGDLFKRFYKISFNKETGLYSTDFADIPDDLMKTLRSLKLHRATDTKIDEVVKVILDRMKVEATESLYDIRDIQEFSEIPANMLENINVKADGLCFYRCVLKGLQENPTPDTKDSYNPSEKESLLFVTKLKRFLQDYKTELRVKPENILVDEYFNEKYLEPHNAFPASISDNAATVVQKNSRIRTGDQWKRMSFDEYLRLMDSPDGFIRPFAEVNDALIGKVAGLVTYTVICVYQKDGDFYRLRGNFNEEYATETKRPFKSFILLEHVGGNHYNLLRLKPGMSFPHAVKVGGGEILDLGIPIYRNSTTRKVKQFVQKPHSVTRKDARHKNRSVKRRNL